MSDPAPEANGFLNGENTFAPDADVMAQGAAALEALNRRIGLGTRQAPQMGPNGLMPGVYRDNEGQEFQVFADGKVYRRVYTTIKRRGPKGEDASYLKGPTLVRMNATMRPKQNASPPVALEGASRASQQGPATGGAA